MKGEHFNFEFFCATSYNIFKNIIPITGLRILKKKFFKFTLKEFNARDRLRFIGYSDMNKIFALQIPEIKESQVINYNIRYQIRHQLQLYYQLDLNYRKHISPLSFGHVLYIACLQSLRKDHIIR